MLMIQSEVHRSTDLLQTHLQYEKFSKVNFQQYIQPFLAKIL